VRGAAVRAVLFDLDDTLLDYSSGVEGHWAAACRAAADPAGLDADALAAGIEAARRWFWGDPVRNRTERVQMLAAWGKIARFALDGIGCSDDALAARIAADFLVRRRDAARLFADARPCLDALRARGHALGLVTNGDASMQRDKLARHELSACFDAIAIEGELGVGKPEAAIFQRVLDELGVVAGDAVMIGDNIEWDVDGAERLGIAGVWIDRAGGDVPRRPRHVVRSLDEAIALVARLRGYP
jgi:HAD superfamily hydrolase (TIGR01509 family)